MLTLPDSSRQAVKNTESEQVDDTVPSEKRDKGRNVVASCGQRYCLMRIIALAALRCLGGPRAPPLANTGEKDVNKKCLLVFRNSCMCG